MVELAFILLLIAAILVRYKKSPRWWGGALMASIVMAYFSAILELPGVIIAVALIALSFHYSCIVEISGGRLAFKLWKMFVWAALIILSLLLAIHVMPGFNNILIHEEVVLSEASRPFSIYANYDKALVAMALLFLVVNSQYVIRKFFRRGLPLLGITAIVVLGTAVLMGHIEWEPKFGIIFFTWAMTNLLITCLAEEAFFRLLVQEQILRCCSALVNKEWIAILGAGSLFGLAHIGGGIDYALLATMAGIFYAYIYHRYRSIEVVVVSHFSVNALHFLFFTYPGIA